MKWRTMWKPQCGAKTRRGTACMAAAIWSTKSKPYTRCKNHGGMSTGPRTAEGIERIRAGGNHAGAVRKAGGQTGSTFRMIDTMRRTHAPHEVRLWFVDLRSKFSSGSDDSALPKEYPLHMTHLLTLILLFVACPLLRAQSSDAPKYRVKLTISARATEDYYNALLSGLSRELRSLGDAVAVDQDPSNELVVVPMQLRSQSGFSTGFAVAATFLRHYSLKDL